MGVWIENDAQKRKTQNSKPHPPTPFFVRLNFAVFVEAAKSRGYRVLQDFAVKTRQKHQFHRYFLVKITPSQSFLALN